MDIIGAASITITWWDVGGYYPVDSLESSILDLTMILLLNQLTVFDIAESILLQQNS